MKRSTITMCVLLAGSLVSGGIAPWAHAGPVASVDLPAAELEQWKKNFKRAGATGQEVRDFEAMLRRQPSADLEAWLEYLRSVQPDFFERYLAGTRRESAQPRPSALFADAAPAIPCAALREITISETVIDSATVDSSDGSCRVTATVTHPPARNPIRVFIALPKIWTGRFMGTGGGAYAGGYIENLTIPVMKGYAAGATDTGNPDGTADFATGPNGKPAWQRMRDNAYIGIHDMTVVGKALTQAFYGRAARYSYFVASSTGGRQALTEAQRYPQDYDGILAISPAIARDRYVPAQLWPQVLMYEAGNFLPKAKRDAATAAAVKACDGADGTIDGIIDDPMRCRYDPVALVGTQIAGSTFTETDARILLEIWEGPRGHDGRFLWWGPTPGTDLMTLADTGGTPLTGKPCPEGLDWFRYFVALDPNWDWETLTRGEFQLMFEQSIQMHANTYGGDDPDLSGFRNRNGRLLIVHGLADEYVPPQATIAYYERVVKRMGGAQRTAEFARLFLVPGADHGFSVTVPTPSPGEMIGALIRWVEQDLPPAQLIADQPDRRGQTIRTRTLTPYR